MTDIEVKPKTFAGLVALIGLKTLVLLVFGSIIAGAASRFADNGRYQMIGATPRGVVLFDTATGDTEVRQPIAFPSTTSTTQPGEES
jgi:hypothetical protein